MHDLVETFDFEGEKLGLLYDYEALYTLEKDFGYRLGPLWDALSQMSAVAGVAALLVGLEAHRKRIEPRAVKWKVEDAQRIYMTLGPVRSCSLAAAGLARSCVTKEPDPAAGKAPKPETASTGTPSS
jgi:hypothetical protein